MFAAAAALVVKQAGRTAVRPAGFRAYSDVAPLIVTIAGQDRPHLLTDTYKLVREAGAEVKESRNTRLAGRFTSMFYVHGNAAKVKDTLAQLKAETLHVADAITPDRPGFQTGDEAAKGPYCTTSPLLPLMRKTSVQVRYKKGVVAELTEYFCSKGITIHELDQFRVGKDVVLECMAHLPSGLAEFPLIKEDRFVEDLEAMGIHVNQFEKVVASDN